MGRSHHPLVPRRRRPLGLAALSSLLLLVAVVAPASAANQTLTVNRTITAGPTSLGGTSYIVDPMGNYVGDRASSSSEELLIRDLDMDLVRTARYDWQFYRDRRPDAYGLITAP